MTGQETKREMIGRRNGLGFGAGAMRAGSAVSAMALLAGLSACAGNQQNTPPGVSGIPSAPSAAAVAAQPQIGVLLPLSGRNAGIGRQMLNAVQLAVGVQNGPKVDARDTAGPGGAADAARQAIGNGDKVLLGPLTAADTGAVGPLAQAAGIPEFAFTSDMTRAQAGVWVLGLTPAQQVRRMVEVAKAAGKTRFAAFVPDNAMGHAMADGLVQACSDLGLTAPTVVTHDSTPDSVTQGLKTLSDYDNRLASAQSAAAAAAAAAPSGPDAVNPTGPDGGASSPGTPSAAAVQNGAGQGAQSQGIQGQGAQGQPGSGTPSLGAPPFDVLLLADTGLQLGQDIAVLKADQVLTGQVQIVGPALWGAFSSKLGALHGAWYAAPDGSSRQSYVSAYRAQYHVSPTPVTDIAYDAGAIAGVLARNGFDTSSLTRSDGFGGVDGVFVLRPDGQVQRGLAVFEIQPGGGARVAVPAPRSLNRPAAGMPPGHAS